MENPGDRQVCGESKPPPPAKLRRREFGKDEEGCSKISEHWRHTERELVEALLNYGGRGGACSNWRNSLATGDMALRVFWTLFW